MGLRLAYDACREGGSMPTVLNAANEKAVALFLDRKIAYLQIADIIEECMLKHTTVKEPSLEEILEIEQKVYSYILSNMINDNKQILWRSYDILVALLIFTVIVVIHEWDIFFSAKKNRCPVFLNFQSEWDQDLLP